MSELPKSWIETTLEEAGIWCMERLDTATKCDRSHHYSQAQAVGIGAIKI